MYSYFLICQLQSCTALYSLFCTQRRGICKACMMYVWVLVTHMFTLNLYNIKQMRLLQINQNWDDTFYRLHSTQLFFAPFLSRPDKICVQLNTRVTLYTAVIAYEIIRLIFFKLFTNFNCKNVFKFLRLLFSIMLTVINRHDKLNRWTKLIDSNILTTKQFNRGTSF